MTWPDLSPPAYGWAVNRALASGVLAGGPETAALEDDFERWLGVRAVAVSSATSGLEAVLRAMGVGDGDEVIVPAYGWPATPQAVLNAGAEVVFADVERDSHNLDPEAVRAAVTERTAAVIPVHLHGLAANVPEIRAAARGCAVIEDAAQAPGASWGRVPVGRLGDAAVFSLNQHKTIFGGEGGVVVTGDDGLANNVRWLRTTAFHGEDGIARVRGRNWKVTEMSAAIARVSLERMPDNVVRAQRAAQTLRDLDVTSPMIPYGATHVFHKVRVTPPDRDTFAARCHAAVVPVSLWQARPLPEHPAFGRREEYDAARRIVNETIVIGDDRHPPCLIGASGAREWVERLA